MLLSLPVSLLPTNGVAATDESEFDRSHATKHYTKRTKLTVQQLKVTLLVDTGADAILERYIPTTRKHDTRVAPSVINRNVIELRVLLGDGGDNDQQIRAMARENGIRLLIKHRKFISLQQAWNARLDAELDR